MERTLFHIFGVLYLGICIYLIALSDLQAHLSTLAGLFVSAVLLFFAMWYLAGRSLKPSKSIVCAILVWGGVLRIVLMFGAVDLDSRLSSDVYRYRWEGLVVSAGQNPYHYAPNADALLELRQSHRSLWERVDHKAVPALYPAASQLLFGAVSSSLSLYYLALFLAECLTLGVLWFWLRFENLPASNLALYALNPLVLFEVMLMGHLDALMIPFMLSGMLCFLHSRVKDSKLRRESPQERPVKHRVLPWYGSALLLTLATLFKQTALIAVACVFVRLRKRFATRHVVFAVLLSIVLAAAVYSPFIGSGHLFGSAQQFASHWRFNGHAFYGIEALVSELVAQFESEIAKVLCGVLVLGIVLHTRSFPLASSAVYVFMAVFLLSPLRYPWYALSYCALLVVCRSLRLQIAALLFSFISMLSYEVWSHPDVWEISLPLGLVQLAPLVLLILPVRRSQKLPSGTKVMPD